MPGMAISCRGTSEAPTVDEMKEIHETTFCDPRSSPSRSERRRLDRREDRHYDVTADTIEGCSCPLFCTCYFGTSADEHMCQANNVYKFRKGSHYGDVDLSDQIVWMSLDLGGEWHKKPGPGMPTKWAVVTFDKKSTPAQREAIGEILNTVFPVKWEKFSTREDTIEWHDDAKMSHAKMAQRHGGDLARQGRDDRPGQEPARRSSRTSSTGSPTPTTDSCSRYSTHHFDGEARSSSTRRRTASRSPGPPRATSSRRAKAASAVALAHRARGGGSGRASGPLPLLLESSRQ